MEFYFVYLLIFVGKVLEVTLYTLRMVLITKGERTIGSIVSFFEVSLYLIIISGVLNNIAQDPFKVVIYALGFAVGSYTGSVLEGKLALGTVQIQIIVKEEHGEALSTYLRDEGYACTVVQGEGKNFRRNILYVIIPRKKLKEVIDKAKGFQSNATITVHETRPVYGVYGVGLKK